MRAGGTIAKNKSQQQQNGSYMKNSKASKSSKTNTLSHNNNNNSKLKRGKAAATATTGSRVGSDNSSNSSGSHLPHSSSMQGGGGGGISGIIGGGGGGGGGGALSIHIVPLSLNRPSVAIRSQYSRRGLHYSGTFDIGSDDDGVDRESPLAMRLMKLERAVIRKSIMIMFCFGLNWIPVMCQLVYNFLAQQDVGGTVGMFTYTMNMLVVVCNPVILIFTDARFRHSIKQSIRRLRRQ